MFLKESEKTSVEGSTSLRTTRSRSRVDSFSNGIPETCAEKTKSSETKLNMEESPEEQTVPDKSKTVDTVAELQGDGDISEAESNCSSVSGLQTPSFIRITRRRQIVIPCQPEFPAKNRQSKKALPSERSRCQEEDDTSEAESCSSTVSGERAQHGTRITRSRQAKINVSPVREAQTEEISDAESWCSGISTERSVHFKRVTRSMRLRMQTESPLQSGRKSEIVVAYTKLPEPVIPSQTIVISDEEQPTKSDSETEQTSLSSRRINEQPSPSKAKYSSAAVASSELKEFISSSPKKMLSKCIKTSPEKERPNDNDYESVDSAEQKVTRDRDTRKAVTKQISADIYEIVESPEEVCDRSLEKSTEATENKSPVKCQDMLSSDHRNFGQSDTSPRRTTPNKNKSNADSPKLDTRKISQSSLLPVEDIIDIDKPCEVGSSQNDSIPSHIIESSDDECRTSVMNIDSDTSPEESVAESSSGITKTAGPENSFTVSLLTSDESDSSENSDLEEIDKEETTSGNQSTLVLDKSHSEGLFVIDKTPGMDTNKPYYLEERDVADDEQSEESSELEDSEEEFIDEDEDLLNASNNILSLSSSIDPGLNVKQLGGLYISFDAGKQKSGSHGVVPLKEKKKDELLQQSIITPGFEKKECVPPLRESLHQLKKQRRAERAKTTGDGWFGMKAPEITDELKNDLKALKMRAAIDPKRFYKKNDREGLPKYFQVGTVMDSPVDFYHARIPKKQRKKNIVEELLADSEFRRYNKRKYQDIMAEKAALAAGKKNRKKKKFRK
ncbi:deoxynucleotidyltransferase terminal-interacting protein 2 isoform X2 [Sceloporus undulatus]|uniref:deoxynucleotidyltransferase terminal-interacting protein 2 isoform X2 n=1 Tax=Sceloporus undulatus TaxID=8520 RepID=UPI001C4CD531|nr:deoxynucleotidyltransferase terminal-interacting protein 2 isoform X2 [Sceloporus undulatus]